MSISEFLKQFDTTQLAIFAYLALPGFISFRVWRLIEPSTERSFSEVLPECIGFGILNALVSWPLFVLSGATGAALYVLLVVTSLLMPLLWPFAARAALQLLQRHQVILDQARTGWDAAFLRREPFFVIAHLTDGRRIGGYYGYQSYAGVYPTSGHLYLEQTWQIDQAGTFVAPVPGTRGLVIKPDDFELIELLAAEA